jgi:hypothetical protein
VLIVGVAAVAGAVVLASASETVDLEGRELAEALDLDFITASEYNSCQGSVVEIEGNLAVCLAGQSVVDTDAWELAKRLQGKTVTDLDRRIHELMMVAGNGTGVEREQALAELAVLWREQG